MDSKFSFLALVYLALGVWTTSAASLNDIDDLYMHAHSPDFKKRVRDMEEPEEAAYWMKMAQDTLAAKLTETPQKAKVKNIIFFLGDGMSVTTVTAARILKGQQVDMLPWGEESELYMETFPYTGVSKTFCSDAQVADSACSATAYLCGTKANDGTLGVTPAVKRYNCTQQNNHEQHVDSIAVWAKAANKSTGVVTTARITHASPAGLYAHSANRNWEYDEIMRDASEGGVDPNVCDDIAEQLILKEPGISMNVIMGGGRRNFIPKYMVDSEGSLGYRNDDRDLIQEWKNRHPEKSAYVESVSRLRDVDTASTDYLFGLFATNHIAYYHEQEEDEDPSLELMTETAINILKKNPEGYFLFVEGGRIDHAHHGTMPQRALWETIEFAKAIEKADEMTDDSETLILVTSDHSHVMTLNGYPIRGNPIYGFGEPGDDELPISTLSYANGPGYKPYVNNERYDASSDPVEDRRYRAMTMAPLYSETHGGDDVLIYAKGPWAHLFTGVHQQNYIPHALAYAGCIGNGPKHEYCTTNDEEPKSNAQKLWSSSSGFIILGLYWLYLYIYDRLN